MQHGHGMTVSNIINTEENGDLGDDLEAEASTSDKDDDEEEDPLRD